MQLFSIVIISQPPWLPISFFPVLCSQRFCICFENSPIWPIRASRCVPGTKKLSRGCFWNLGITGRFCESGSGANISEITAKSWGPISEVSAKFCGQHTEKFRVHRRNFGFLFCFRICCFETVFLESQKCKFWLFSKKIWEAKKKKKLPWNYFQPTKGWTWNKLGLLCDGHLYWH